MGKARSSWDFEEEDDGMEALQRAGKALAGKGKDATLRALKSAGEQLAEAPQSSDAAKLASRDLAKALGRQEYLRHKDKEVRLYAALCLVHILRIHAPQTPYTDDQLRSIFELLNGVYGELEDPASPHFQLCLSIVETVSQVKCSLLLLDLPGSEDLVVELFTALMDAVNEANAEVLQGTVLELLRSMIEEADDLPQAQLDVLLARLLPGHRDASPAGHALAAALLQRTETTVQPYLQKFLNALLVGHRTDSELKGDYHTLFYAIHETVPQALLPLLPLLKDELQADGEGAHRGPAVDLVARLITQHPSGSAIIAEYPVLLEALLGRACDKEAEVRRKLLEFALPLLEACGEHAAWQSAVVKATVGRLFDLDDSVRHAAVAAVAALLAVRPALAGSTTGTEGRGSVLSCLGNRLRDKKASVRREVASQLAGLFRSWVLAAEASPAHAPAKQHILAIPVVVLNVAVRDSDLGSHVLDVVFRAGFFPPKLPPAAVARWWAAMWRHAGDENRSMLASLLRVKGLMQRQVQALIQLRAAAKEHRSASLAGAASSMGGATAGAGTSGAAPAGSNSLLSGGGAAGGRVADPEARLQRLVHELAELLKGVSRAEEGLQKLLEQKDNHIFRHLSTLATPGCTYKDAVAAGKEVMQRVGSKGAAAELARVLVARLTPNLLSPEVLYAGMEAAGQSEEVQHFLVDMATHAPQLLAQSMDHVVEMFDADDPLLAGCAAKVLARAARPMLAHCAQTKQVVPEELPDKLLGMCSEAGPSSVKAAVKALVAVLGPEQAAGKGAELADQLLEQLQAPATLRSHSRLLACLKGLSMLGRLLPDVFERVADETVDFVLGEVLEVDLSRGKPLAAAEPGKTGRKWRHPSPSTAVKSAALRTLCQALVPDNPRAKLTQPMVDRSQRVWALLEQLLDTDAEAEQFAPFAFVFPRASDDEPRSKRQRVDGAGSVGEEDEAEEEDEELECTDAAWVRYSAVCGLLRLARAYDSSMPASLYANLALTFQEPLVETRRAMTAKLARTVGWLTKHTHLSQRAAKYSAILALMAIDPEDGNRRAAMRALRAYVVSRRADVARQSAATAKAGGGGGILLQDMPEFMLPFLIFLLAHHPDYPTAEVLGEFSQADPEEREEMYGAGGTPFIPFVGMLQFGLEALVVPADPSPAEVARLLPATIKLLRTLKHCEDASAEEPRSEEAHQLCDVALALCTRISSRLAKGEPQAPGHFPGQVVLPRMCFRANPQLQARKLDGSDLPDSRYFDGGLFQDDLFLRRLLMPGLPGPAKGNGRPRPKGSQQQRQAKRRKAGGAAKGGGRAAQEEEDSEMAEASEDESVGGTPGPMDAEERAQQQPGSSARPRKRAAAAAAAGGGKRKQGGRRGSAGDGSGEESWGGGGEEEGAALAPGTKKGSGSGSRKKGGASRAAKPAPTPTRQQPRRGAKPEAAGKMREEPTDDELEEEEEQQQLAGESSGEEAAASPAGSSLDADAPAPQARRPKPAAAAPAPAAAAADKWELRADTDDEEEGWEEDEEEEQAAPTRPAQKPAKQPAKPAQAAAQKGKRGQQQQQDEISPGQENRAGGNGAGKAQQRGGKAAAPKAKPGKAAPAAAAQGKAKPGLKRARA